MVKISPSLMCMDLTQFENQIYTLNPVADYYHVDIMDGHYVKNMTLSPWFIEQLNKASKVPVDVHLMVTNPIDYIDKLLNLGVSIITIHSEHLVGHAFRISDYLHENSCRFGVALNPETSISDIEEYLNRIDIVTVMTVDPGFAGQAFINETIKKIESLKKIRAQSNLHFEIQIDGACNEKSYKKLIEAGADCLILGSSGLFGLDESIEKAVKIMETKLEIVKNSV